MRLAITKYGTYSADVYCSDTRSAKRTLREIPVSILAIDYDLVGRENGEQLIRWAKEHSVLPSYVVVTERDRGRREKLSNVLRAVGFRSADQTNFIKH